MYPSLILSAIAVAIAVVVMTVFHLGTTLPLLILFGFVVYRVLAERGKRALRVALPVLLLALILPVLAFAADTAPETVAQATSDATRVTWAWGALAQQWAGAIEAAILAAVAFALRQLPAQIYAVIVSVRADQLINKAIDYGINMVAGASKDNSLSVDVHNEVLAKALQYVLDNAPGWLQTWLGGPEQIANKIIARLNIAPDATAPDAGAAVSAVKT